MAVELDVDDGADDLDEAGRWRRPATAAAGGAAALAAAGFLAAGFLAAAVVGHGRVVFRSRGLRRRR